jgi:hypothetical protein
MSRLPEGRREVNPSKEVAGRRQGVSFGKKLGVSVPISIGLPIVIVGLFLLITAVTTDRPFWFVVGGAVFAVGAILFASGKRL